MTSPLSPSGQLYVNLVATPNPPARVAGFAKLLEAHRAEAPAPAPSTPAPAAKAAESAAADNAEASRAEETRTRQQRANRAQTGRPTTADAPPAAGGPEAGDRPEAAAVAPDARRVQPAEDEPIDPALADWLAGLNLPATPAAPTAPDAPVADAFGAATPPATAGADAAVADLATRPEPADRAGPRRASPAAGGTETAQRQREAPEDLAVKAAADNRADPAAAVLPAAAFAQVMSEAAAVPADQRARGGEPVAKVDGTAAAQALSGASALNERPATEVAAPTVVHVPAPVESPEFPKALGAQLSVFAKEGVQQAELHLNPADMGPISVQIALDGTQAKVDFGADSAATRELIETGLPELAAALRDAGFTLSGGGVHSQARQPGQREREGGREPGEPGGRAAMGGDDTAPVARATVRTVRAGGVDLYA